jgi:hypothetical protein
MRGSGPCTLLKQLWILNYEKVILVAGLHFRVHHLLFSIPYSYRSASMGSTLVARRAGI